MYTHKYSSHFPQKDYCFSRVLKPSARELLSLNKINVQIAKQPYNRASDSTYC